MPAIPTGRIINGHRYDSSSIVITAKNTPYADITEISYSDSLEPGMLQGTSVLPRGRTRGQYKAEASFTIGKGAFEALKAGLVAGSGGMGFGEVTFLITVTYRASGEGAIITDLIEGCRIQRTENSHSAGNGDALVVKCDLNVDRIKWNGEYMVNEGGLASTLVGL